MRQEFTHAVWRTLAPETASPSFDSWEALFENLFVLVGDRRTLVILDEFPWMREADSSLASRLQNLRDHRIKETNIILILAGSHIGMMSRLFEDQSPLYGRFTAQRKQADQRRLPFMPDHVGSHWGSGIQIDVATINWTEKWLLLGECNWGLNGLAGNSYCYGGSLSARSRCHKRECHREVRVVRFARDSTTGFKTRREAKRECRLTYRVILLQ